MATYLVNALLIVFVILLFGACIFVHELGHLLAGLWRKLYIERFSVGFGHRLWGVTRNGVEYVVSALPFGGYVALPQLEPTEEPKDRDGNILPPAPPLDRIITAVAGPLFNIAFGFLLAAILWQVGVYEPTGSSFTVREVPEDSAEFQAGLRPGDVIHKIDGEPFDGGFRDLVERIVTSLDQAALTVERDGAELEIAYELVPHPDPKYEGLPYPRFEVYQPTMFRYVLPDGPAARAGLQEGDIVHGVNGARPHDPIHFRDLIEESGGQPMSLTVLRDNEELAVHDLRAERTEPEQAGEMGRYVIGVMPATAVRLGHPTPWKQFVTVWERTQRTLRAVVSSRSKIGADDLSGPIGIIGMLWLQVREGLRQALSFVILLNFNLALLNLLPIPVLDGGHILFATIEGVTRRRIPIRFARAVQTACAVLLIGFILYVTVHDFGRLGHFVKALRQDPQEETGEPSPSTPDDAPPDVPGAIEDSPEPQQ